MSPHAQLLKLANILSLAAVIGSVFIYGGFIADPTLGVIDRQHPTLLSPHTYFVVSFWALETFLLTGLCVVQYRTTLDKPITEGISVWLTIANTLLVAWSFLWLDERFISAAVVVALQWLVIQIPLLNFNHHVSLVSPLHSGYIAYFFVRVPMSLYAGWLLPDVFCSISVAYTRQDGNPTLYKILATVFLVLIGLGGMKARKDIYYVMAIAMYLIGIGVREHEEPLIAWTALVMGTLGLITIAVHKYNTYRLLHEQQPLLGH
jgi:hypothetical protein